MQYISLLLLLKVLKRLKPNHFQTSLLNMVCINTRENILLIYLES